MKFFKEWFPLGSFKRQETDGMYLDDYLAKNLDVLARSIHKDMHFTGLISGSGSVRVGKSTIATHVGCYLTGKINEFHGMNNSFTDRNICFKVSDLIERSFEFAAKEKHSVLILDEGDELTGHNMKQFIQDLKRYFRRCGQLNQIIILILPEFFEFPKFFALGRSQFLINVKFFGEFDRGRFDFYSGQKKRILYLKGKKEWDYDVVKPNFYGNFFGSYTFYPNLEECIKGYNKGKQETIIEAEEEENANISKYLTQRNILVKMLLEKGATQGDIAKYLTRYGQRITQQALSLSINTINKRENDFITYEVGDDAVDVAAGLNNSTENQSQSEGSQQMVKSF